MKQGLTQNQLKLFAAVCMVVDHVGLTFFPQYMIFRIIGRFAFPIFAYGIFEGMLYTKSPLKYLRNLCAMGLACVAGYYAFSGELFGNILITFTLSGVILLGLRLAARGRSAAGAALAAGGLVAAYFICLLWQVDYGFFGVLAPVLPALCRLWLEKTRRVPQKLWQALQLDAFALGLCALAMDYGATQFFALLALVPMAASMGIRGRHKLKSFFYIFYPAHLALIGCISMIISQ